MTFRTIAHKLLTRAARAFESNRSLNDHSQAVDELFPLESSGREPIWISEVDQRGQIFIPALVNGKENVNFLFDPGADVVVLPISFMTKFGFGDLPYLTAGTSGGGSNVRPFEIDTFKIGSVMLERVPAVFAPTKTPLMGMSVLVLLDWQMKRGVLALYAQGPDDGLTIPKFPGCGVKPGDLTPA